MASRYGGEEFTLLRPEATRESTRVRAEQLRRAVQQLPGPYASRVFGQIPLSRGGARFPQHGSSAPALRHAAASALYAAKHGGRDRVAGASAI
jgi:diguanylate cyclase (GGDEF)-like protein